MKKKKVTPCQWVIVLLANLFWAVPNVYGQYHANLNQSNAQEAIWVDSVFNSMTFDQRLGQLFMVRAHSNLGPEHVKNVESLIRQYHVGGMCFFQGTPEEQVRLINRYQSLSDLPLMMAIDGEWGLGMRLKKSTISYPRQLMLGAIRNNELIYKMGAEIARQMKRVGIHVNFAPVVDVNNNANNPVIGTRSFGEDRINVSIKGINYMKGMQDNGILACAKHFPGHGDTDMDSHYDLPVIPHDRNRLDSIEIYPFRELVYNGIGSIMVAHLQVPALEQRPNRPTTLSKPTVTNLLKDSLNFHGLVFTDGLGMKGVTKHFADGKVDAEAILAGNDILLLPEDLVKTKAMILQYMNEGKFTEQDINHRVKRVLRSKYRLGLTHFTPIIAANVRADLNTAEAIAIKEELIENALTLVRDHQTLLPISNIEDMKLASLAIGAKTQTKFQDRLLDYAPFYMRQCDYELSKAEKSALLTQMKNKDLVVVSLHNMGRSASNNFGLTPSIIEFLTTLQEQNKLALVVFGNPYSLKHLDDINTILEAYNEDPMTQDIAAQAVFGANGINGKLPITASVKSPYNAGISRGRNFRIGYTVPERVGMDSDTLKAYIDAIAKEAISANATPGCVVLVARQGKVIFHEAYGHHTYSRARQVRKDDVYDLASVTKIAATTMSIMDLVQKGQLDLDKGLGHYIPELKETNKDTISIRSVLAHHGALKPWIPFYSSTLNENGSRLSDVYKSRQSGVYNVKVTDNLFMDEAYIDSIWQSINLSELRSNNNYRYSDLGFYYLSKIVENTSGQSLDVYARERFYKPLGLFNIGYNPSQYFSPNRIPPTEEDNYWRDERVQAYVHDMGAAMLGGVSGHAGLFANAHDMAIVGQMLLQKGFYGNQVYFKSDIVKEFTCRYNGTTRRGLGFDMKQLNQNLNQNMCADASDAAFGHLGFTGTCIWVDPAEDLVFVFLSNRTYPSMRNNKLGRMDIRPRIQSAAYKSIFRSIQPPVIQPLAGVKLPEEVHSIN